jgi:hypothetical protein
MGDVRLTKETIDFPSTPIAPAPGGVPVAPVGTARMAFDAASGELCYSESGSPWIAIADLASGGWTDAGTYVELTTLSDELGVGAGGASADGRKATIRGTSPGAPVTLVVEAFRPVSGSTTTISRAIRTGALAAGESVSMFRPEPPILAGDDGDATLVGLDGSRVQHNGSSARAALLRLLPDPASGERWDLLALGDGAPLVLATSAVEGVPSGATDLDIRLIPGYDLATLTSGTVRLEPAERTQTILTVDCPSAHVGPATVWRREVGAPAEKIVTVVRGNGELGCLADAAAAGSPSAVMWFECMSDDGGAPTPHEIEVYAVGEAGGSAWRWWQVYDVDAGLSGFSVSVQPGFGSIWQYSQAAGGLRLRDELGTEILAVASGGQWSFANTTGWSIKQAAVDAPAAAPLILEIIGGAHTNLPSGTEATDVVFDLSRGLDFDAGALANQRSVRILPPTLNFDAPSNVGVAATLALAGAPIAGVNCTITGDDLTLHVESGWSRFDGPIDQTQAPAADSWHGAAHFSAFQLAAPSPAWPEFSWTVEGPAGGMGFLRPAARTCQAIVAGSVITEWSFPLGGAPRIGFLGAASVPRQVVAGAKLPGDVVMASVLAALVALGLITDTTT